MADLLMIVFQELDPIWLKSIWDADRSICLELLEIIFRFYLAKCRPQYFQNNSHDMYYYSDDQSLTDTFGDPIMHVPML